MFLGAGNTGRKERREAGEESTARHEVRRARAGDEETRHRSSAVEAMSTPRTLGKEKPRGCGVVVKSGTSGLGASSVGRSSTTVFYLVCGVLLLPAVASDGEECYCDRQG